MGSKKTYSFRRRLFVSLTIVLWTSVIAMMAWQYYHERHLRAERIHNDLDNVSVRIINAYERNYNPLPFIDFVAHNFTTDPNYKDLRISVYLDGRLYYNYGQTLPLDRDLDDKLKEDSFTDHVYPPSESFYNSLSQSGDKRLSVIVDAPNNSGIKAATTPHADSFLPFLIIALLLTAVLYFSTRMLGQSVTNLKTFTQMALSGSGKVPEMQFPHDDLGEISSQIVELYNDRTRVTEKLRREHNVAMHAMEEKSRIKRQMTSNINHELKTPIGVIKGYLDTLVQNPDMDATTRDHFIRKSLEHTNRLVSLINDIATMTRLEEGAKIISTEDLDFHNLVYSLASEIQESGEVSPMEFVYDIPLTCHVRGNFTLLTAMLHNLAKNAAAYSKGTECGILYKGEDQRMVHFEFYDNGRGVGAEHIPHLFERFYRIDAGRARKSGGTGLGLSIVENTVHAHGGSITVSNRPEGGLVFRFSLPK